METKQFIAIFAVVALACAGIGSAFAYNATLTNDQNTVSTDFLALDATEFSGTFDYKIDSVSAPVKYDSVTKSENTLTFTPEKANGDPADPVIVLDNTKAVAINSSPYTVKIDSSGMNTGDLFTFAVSPKVSGAQVDLQAKYWMAYTVNGISNYVKLSGDASPIAILVSDTVSTSAAPIEVALTLYAVEFDGYRVDKDPVKQNVPIDYATVDFEFTATASTLPTTSVKAKLVSGETPTVITTPEATNVALYSDNGFGTLYQLKMTQNAGIVTIEHAVTDLYFEASVQGYTQDAPVQLTASASPEETNVAYTAA